MGISPKSALAVEVEWLRDLTYFRLSLSFAQNHEALIAGDSAQAAHVLPRVFDYELG